jgi:Holliday junction resolvase RusA-like endonuclease
LRAEFARRTLERAPGVADALAVLGPVTQPTRLGMSDDELVTIGKPGATPEQPDAKSQGGAHGSEGCCSALDCARPVGQPFLVLEVSARPASYSSAAQRPWQVAVRAEVARRHVTPKATRFGVRIAFRMPIKTNANEVWDLDNLVKPTLDAMDGVFGIRPWRGLRQAADDRVDYLEASKRTIREGESPGARIEIFDLARDTPSP